MAGFERRDFLALISGVALSLRNLRHKEPTEQASPALLAGPIQPAMPNMVIGSFEWRGTTYPVTHYETGQDIVDVGDGVGGFVMYEAGAAFAMFKVSDATEERALARTITRRNKEPQVAGVFSIGDPGKKIRIKAKVVDVCQEGTSPCEVTLAITNYTLSSPNRPRLQ